MQTIVTLISTVVAIISAGLAWQAAKVAGKSYSAELIGMLYSTYQSDDMLRDLKIAWGYITNFGEKKVTRVQAEMKKQIKERLSQMI